MNEINSSKSGQWLALVIGNSRLHWGYFQGDKLQKSWHTPHVTNKIVTQTIPKSLLIPEVPNDLPIYLASVVPEQTKLWDDYAQLNLITLEQIPLKKLYPTLGIDRALSVLGSGKKYGFPCLVIDAGTALTFTGVDDDLNLVGGAILPGLSLQFQVLANSTAALPWVHLPNHLPPRWSTTTPDGIQSGIIYTILAGVESFINDWLEKFTLTKVVFTGGDSVALIDYLQSKNYPLVDYIYQDQNLIFEGIKYLGIN